MDDPDGERMGRTRGILVLNVQLLIFKDELLLEPVAPPGIALKSFIPAQTREDVFTVAKRRQAEIELISRKEAFASSPGAIKASDEAFYGILEAFGILEATFREQGSPIEIVRKHFGLSTVIGAYGWWASIIWERYMNTLQNSRLTIKKWDGHPPFPDVMLIRKPNCVTVDQYTFGLVSATEARWISLSNNRRNLTSMEIAENILQDFMSNPLSPPAPWFE